MTTPQHIKDEAEAYASNYVEVPEEKWTDKNKRDWEKARSHYIAGAMKYWGLRKPEEGAAEDVPLFSEDNNKFVSLFMKALKEPLSDEEIIFVTNYAKTWQASQPSMPQPSQQGKEDEAVRFAEWICKNGYDSIQIMVAPKWTRAHLEQEYTSSELYQIFKQSK